MPIEDNDCSGLSYFFGLLELRAVRLQWTIKSIVGLSTGPTPSKINVITDMGSFKVYCTSGNFSLLHPQMEVMMPKPPLAIKPSSR